MASGTLITLACQHRGGGDYGNDWWEHGHLLEKQNSFDDFASCAEYLHAAGYSSPGKLTIQVLPFGMHADSLLHRPPGSLTPSHAVLSAAVVPDAYLGLLQGGSNGGLLMGTELTQVGMPPPTDWIIRLSTKVHAVDGVSSALATHMDYCVYTAPGSVWSGDFTSRRV